jgi:hypothetical protein
MNPQYSDTELHDIVEGVKIKAVDLQAWFKKVDKVKVLAKGFSDADAVDQLDRQIDRMNQMYKALTGDNSPSVLKGESLVARIEIEDAHYLILPFLSKDWVKPCVTR